MRVLTMIVLVTLLGVSASLPAQTQDDNASRCGGSDTDQSIAGCTALIQSGQLSGASLAIAYTNRGNAYDDKGAYDQAIQDYTKAIQVNPSYATAYYNRGDAYNNKGEYDQAIQDFNQALRLNPSLALAFSDRAYAYEHKGEYEQAIQDDSQALKLNPSNAAAFNARCWDRALVGRVSSRPLRIATSR